jgi:hypothetical protein
MTKRAPVSPSAPSRQSNRQYLYTASLYRERITSPVWAKYGKGGVIALAVIAVARVFGVAFARQIHYDIRV